MTPERTWKNGSIVLTEYTETNLVHEILEEDKTTNRPPTYRLKGIFQRGDDPNGNRRIYPTQYLEREINRLRPLVAERKILGELDHPANREKPKLSEVSHLISFLEMRGKEVYGELDIIPGTVQGDNLLALYRAGVKLGISSRGTGGLRPLPGGLFEVDETLVINTWDVVSEPSVADAILHEGLMVNNRMQRTKSAIYFFDKALFS